MIAKIDTRKKQKKMFPQKLDPCEQNHIYSMANLNYHPSNKGVTS